MVVDIRQLVVVVQVTRLAHHRVKVMLAVSVQPMQLLLHRAVVVVARVRSAGRAQFRRRQTGRAESGRPVPSQGQAFIMQRGAAAHQTVQPQLAGRVVSVVAERAGPMGRRPAFRVQ